MHLEPIVRSKGNLLGNEEHYARFPEIRGHVTLPNPSEVDELCVQLFCPTNEQQVGVHVNCGVGSHSTFFNARRYFPRTDQGYLDALRLFMALAKEDYSQVPPCDDDDNFEAFNAWLNPFVEKHGLVLDE